MTKEQFYANDKEWLEQKARVVTYRERINKYMRLMRNATVEDRDHLEEAISWYRFTLCLAEQVLAKIEGRLDREWLERLLSRDAFFMDDDEIEFRILTNGYIGGTKL